MSLPNTVMEDSKLSIKDKAYADFLFSLATCSTGKFENIASLYKELPAEHQLSKVLMSDKSIGFHTTFHFFVLESKTRGTQ